MKILNIKSKRYHSLSGHSLKYQTNFYSIIPPLFTEASQNWRDNNSHLARGTESLHQGQVPWAGEEVQ